MMLRLLSFFVEDFPLLTTSFKNHARFNEKLCSPTIPYQTSGPSDNLSLFQRRFIQRNVEIAGGYLEMMLRKRTKII